MKKASSILDKVNPNRCTGGWVRVEYDEPVGKHDGTVAGKRYFEARNKHGGFVRPSKVTFGDFPEALDEELEKM